jgi:hypothetical protein
LRYHDPSGDFSRGGESPRRLSGRTHRCSPR